MTKKSVTIALIILGFLIFSAGSAYSSWFPNFGPIVFQGPPGDGHPWGESGHTSNDNHFPAYYRPASGSDYPDFMSAPTFSNFVLQFYLRYVIKQEMRGQSSIRNRKAE